MKISENKLPILTTVAYCTIVVHFISSASINIFSQPLWLLLGLVIYGIFSLCIHRWHQSGMPIIGYMIFYSSWFFLAHILVNMYGYIASLPLETTTRMIIYITTAILISIASVATAFYHFRKNNISVSDLNTNFSITDKFTFLLLLATMFFSGFIEYNESDPLARLGTYALSPFVMLLFGLPMAWSFVKGYQNKTGIIAFTGSWIILYFVPMVVLVFASNTALNIADHPWSQADIRQFNLVVRPYRYTLVFAFLAWLLYRKWSNRWHTAQ